MSGALQDVAASMPGPVGDEFARLHHESTLGTDAVTQWRAVADHPQLGPLGRTMVRAFESGAPVADAVAALGGQLREARRFEVESRARSVDVKAAAPLGLCLLPAFVLVAIVPLVAGLINSALVLR